MRIVLVSPKLADNEHSFILSKNARPASNPFYFSNNITASFHLLLQFHIVDAISKGIFHLIYLCAALKLPYFNVFAMSIQSDGQSL
jgi:hypothetical protein